jgi:hypothetical protein
MVVEMQLANFEVSRPIGLHLTFLFPLTCKKCNIKGHSDGTTSRHFRGRHNVVVSRR